ncbi:STM4014 family protein [Actinoplanes sp. NPDC051861]|uniref:STM4014 family protein n=1 Tax=Actinoplanes sp. NPDC051861 TaxID=3155170 RepID=UPI0034442A20
MRVAVVGNPSNRRVARFQAAAERVGAAERAGAGERAAGLSVEVWPWHDVLSTGRVPGAGRLVRIDSPGEDAAVDRLLRGPGAPAAEHGEILGLAAAFGGLRDGLARIEAGGGTLLNQPADILAMTDKARCHAMLEAAGIPVPPALTTPVSDYGSLLAGMREAGWGRVFVKPAYGSSASGVIALAVHGRRVLAITSVELSGEKIFNSLRVRRYENASEVAAIVDRLAPDGLHVERWYPKASLGNRVLDLRVVVIAGEPRHTVVRTSRSPMTNLHLGNARGDVAAVRAAAGETAWARAMRTCAEVARLFPRTLHVGVDLMFRAGWRGHAVAEVNAFGDLLPGVVADGRDTYESQAAAIVNGWAGAACAT